MFHEAFSTRTGVAGAAAAGGVDPPPGLRWDCVLNFANVFHGLPGAGGLLLRGGLTPLARKIATAAAAPWVTL